MNRTVLLVAAAVAAFVLLRRAGAFPMLLSSSAPPSVPGWYGPRWKNNRPTLLPASAPGASETGAARDYIRSLAEAKSTEAAWVEAMDHMAGKESAWTMGRPADAFDRPNSQAWGVFQYFSSSAKDESKFGAWRGKKVWDMPWELQATAPIERFWVRYNEAINASPTKSTWAGVVGVFLHQAKPGWRHRYWTALKVPGATPATALKSLGGDEAAIRAILGHAEQVMGKLAPMAYPS